MLIENALGVLRAKPNLPRLNEIEVFRMTLSEAMVMTEPRESAKRSRPLVLIVDDFEDNRAMYAEYLTYSGYEVEQAADGQEAVHMTQRLLPDVVVMDLSLPILDGWEATRRVKADARTRNIPIIALSGHALARHSRGAREAGCDAFLAKPCLPETLVEKIQELIRQT